MPSQLMINQGPQDALLYDNTRSYFTNVGYVRTSNFQVELRDVDPQNSANLGSTMQFVIPKSGDLLGPVDLMIDFNKATNGASGKYASWVETLGFAMIERIVFSIGSNDIETITGDQLNITNELMKSDEHRLGLRQVLKTGRPAVAANVSSGTWTPYTDSDTTADNSQRHIFAGAVNYDGKKLIIPLGLFFTKHPSQYFPLCAIAGCNDVRISVKLRPLNELILLQTTPDATGANIDDADAPTGTVPAFESGTPISECRLRCHYVHVTGPEATTIMNKEHVRLLKLWHHNPKPVTISSSANGTKFNIPIDLSFLHPVQELIITVRKASEMSSSTDTTAKPSLYDQGARTKNYFAYHGGGKDPNMESIINSQGSTQANAVQSYLQIDNFKLSLNGQERHPSLASSGLDRNYLMNRLMPMLHSNTTSTYQESVDGITLTTAESDFKRLAESFDRKEIYVYPFSLNPEGSNPSGAVNFSKVSHAKLNISGTAFATDDAKNIDYQVDVYGIYYNWVMIKEGRALISFA
eukprot:6174295-Pleurochrysis_carterae.AAC.1